MTQSPVPGIEVDAALDRAGGAYLYQESIRILVTILNKNTAPRSIPYLVEHSIGLELRNASGQVRRADRHFKPPPPLINRPEPEVTLEPHETVTYPLPLEPTLGSVAPGRYAVRLIVAGGPLPFTTTWLDFSVAASQPTAVRSAPSSARHATEARVAWRDDGISPPQILLQSRIVVGRPIAATTHGLGAADSTSEPALGTSPGDASRLPAWAGWVAGGNLILARQYGDAVNLHRDALPAGRFQVVNPFSFSERPDESGTHLHGVLLDGPTGRLIAFSSDGSKSAFSSAAGSHAGPIEGVAAAPIDETRLATVATRIIGNRRQFEGWIFSGIATSGPVVLGELDGSIDGVAAAYELEQQTGHERIHWAAWQRPARTTAVRMIQGTWDVSRGPAAAPPKVREVPSAPGTSHCDGSFDEMHRLWLLCVGSGGVQLFGPDHPDSVQVQLPAGARYEALIFRRGTMPQVFVFNPLKGFDTIKVDFDGPPPAEPEEQEEED